MLRAIGLFLVAAGVAALGAVMLWKTEPKKPVRSRVPIRVVLGHPAARDPEPALPPLPGPEPERFEPPPSPPPVTRPFLADTAAAWRARLRKDPAHVERLGEMLMDTERSSEVTEMIALVLGSLEDPRADTALRRALAEGSAVPRSVLLTALGMARTWPDDLIFFFPAVEHSASTPAGFRVPLRRGIDSPELRQLMSGYLLDDEPAVRRAATEVLVGSMQFEDVRERLLRALRTEPDVEMREAWAGALADWTGEAPDDHPQKLRIVETLLKWAAEPEAHFLRAAVQDGLKRAALTPEELAALEGLTRAKDLEIRRWAEELLVAQSGWR